MTGVGEGSYTRLAPAVPIADVAPGLARATYLHLHNSMIASSNHHNHAYENMLALELNGNVDLCALGHSLCETAKLAPHGLKLELGAVSFCLSCCDL